MMDDAREELFENLMMILISEGVDIDAIKPKVQLTLGKFEISDRCTEVALLHQDRNEYLIKKFILAKKIAGRTEKTLSFYAHGLRFIFDQIGKTIDDITPDDIRMYLAIRQTRDGISKTTAGNELRILSTFFQYLHKEELIEKNPVEKIEPIKYAKKRDEVAFTDEEVERIRLSARDTRDRAIIEILFSTGCRVTELVQMRIEEIKDDKVVVHGKGEKDRVCYLNAKAKIALEQYLAERRDANPYVFPSSKSQELHLGQGTVEKICRRLGSDSGVENCHPHRFRRTFATHALQHGMPLEKVSKMLGHEQLDTTKIYINIDEEEMEQAHRRYVV